MKTERIIHGRNITPQEVVEIRTLLLQHPEWSRRRLSLEVSATWNWRNAKGQLRDMACRTVLLRLHRSGLIKLPPGRHNGNNQRRQDCIRAMDVDTAPLQAHLSAIRPLKLVIALPGTNDHVLFKHLVHTYHYLSHRHVPGEKLSYIVYSCSGRPVGCLLFAAAAWKCASRDTFIGWNSVQRQANLTLLANNTRFLIPPWVEVKCLASHVLSLVQQRIAVDWTDKYGHPLYLLETFVDRSRFVGTCYKAANWTSTGSTTGRSRNDRHHKINTSVKDTYLYPLQRGWRRELC